ncbi:hypothetical protein HPB51_013009 [Rhipicephalus microplus]|uniref:Myb-like domain-containing protein n=1 Tax=Rhipicephalus microplus TaxID=6941 RepID=A0A9J6F2S2_RHIMP|nr:hypothetical protein HPB51_013009 [Rhipicephalus microplus]
MESARSVKKKPRVKWTEKETWALIKLWEDHLDALRGQKHNGGVYQAIAESLTNAASSVGFVLILRISFLGFLKFLLWVIFIDCIGMGVLVATALW